MKNTHLKAFFLITLLAPILPFANEVNEENHSVGERISKTKKTMEEGISQSIFSQYPPVYYSPAVHSLNAISALGDWLELEDGSVWKISSFDISKIFIWKTTDLILVTQNHRWFSKYKYKIVNQTTGASTEANLHLGPIKEGKDTRYVEAIDTLRDEVFLTDKTRWKISTYDRHSFEEWMLNDAVIIGYNSGWDSDCQALLINVNLNECVRAEQF